jgi:hypothetical protein
LLSLVPMARSPRLSDGGNVDALALRLTSTGS